MTPTLPTTLRAGDTLSETFDVPEYSAADSWGLTFTLSSAANKYTATCSASGAQHVLAVTAATTAAWVAAAYSWVAHVSKAGARHTVASGAIQVLPDLAGAGGGVDSRSPARQALDAAEAALATYGARAYLQGIDIGERSQKFHSPGEFLKFIDSLRAQVAAEDRADRLAQGLAPKNKLLVRFTGR
jgi:hypothetical protein